MIYYNCSSCSYPWLLNFPECLVTLFLLYFLLLPFFLWSLFLLTGSPCVVGSNGWFPVDCWDDLWCLSTNISRNIADISSRDGLLRSVLTVTSSRFVMGINFLIGNRLCELGWSAPGQAAVGARFIWGVCMGVLVVLLSNSTKPWRMGEILAMCWLCLCLHQQRTPFSACCHCITLAVPLYVLIF